MLALLTVAVTAAVGGSAAAYNLAPTEGNAEFGSASHSVVFDEPDPLGLGVDIPAAREWFGTVGVISRRFGAVPGLFDPVELRGQDPGGRYGAPMLALVGGRYPTAAGEVAVTNAVATTFDVGIGGTFRLDGAAWTVVGTVENPSDFDDEFALTASAGDAAPQAVTLLVDATNEEVESFRAPSGAVTLTAARPIHEGALAAGGVLAAGVVVLILVGLVAAAGFVVLAHRRLRQLGMLAAIGATQKHLRLVLLANGAVIGAIAAMVGTAFALGAWLAIAPSLETVVGHRIALFDVPWWLIGAGLVLALVTATAAAWAPARAVARVAIVTALSGRPPQPQQAHRSAVVAGLLVIVGVSALALAGDPRESWTAILLIIAGTTALIAGVLSVSPLAVRSLAALCATRAPVSVRVALRDLARYRARSAAALAAISLALGVAAAIVISVTAALYTSAAEGNLSDRQLLVRVGEIPSQGDVAPIPERRPAEVDRLDAAIDEMAAGLSEATVTALDVAVAPTEVGFGGLPAVALTERVEPGEETFRILTFLYVASADILEHYDVELAAVSPQTEILTVETGELWFQPVAAEVVDDVERLAPGYSSVPGSFITPDALDRRGWEAGRAAWLVETSGPITDAQFAVARDLAASTGVTIEMRHDQANLALLRSGATAAGGLVALGVMALTVGLIRSEAGADLRILTASGATSGNRRMITAATAGGLALLGALLGTGGAYLGLGTAHLGDLGALSPIPVLHLLVIAAGVPLVAVVGGWFLAGREPSSLARPLY